MIDNKKSIDDDNKNGKYVDGNWTYWFKNDEFHREDGAARIHINGHQEWFINDKHHREDGSAFISIEDDGSIQNQWWINGKRHREDGPAVEFSNGKKNWFLHGVEYTEEEFNQWLEKKKLNEILKENLLPKNIQKRTKI